MERQDMRRFLLLAVVLLGSLTAWAQAPQRIYLVRHCEKALESTDDPNLSEAGRARAEQLTYVLQSAGIQAIWSTQTKRTQQTGSPTAQRLGLTIQPYDARNKDFADEVKKSGRHTLVVCHSNNLANMLNSLTGRSDITPSDEYGELYIVTVGAGEPTVLKLHF
jgi:phosphohistidine phosphatase SixA